ncbi:unnamed protein product [Pieris brassicae]|uniref:Kindlin-2 N-terminal domain-containing protein n=1 Tax=Pieris brassicae TaxID=7116 RepID=A0A9P0XE39_PIEBR|nr:unnamed protein product [Pieris brassicae]
MLADGEIVGDGSWNLTIYVTDMNEKRTMVVKGDMHIGGVMLKLTESFGKDLTGLSVIKATPIPDLQGLPCERDARCAYAGTRPSRTVFYTEQVFSTSTGELPMVT